MIQQRLYRVKPTEEKLMVNIAISAKAHNTKYKIVRVVAGLLLSDVYCIIEKDEYRYNYYPTLVTTIRLLWYLAFNKNNDKFDMLINKVAKECRLKSTGLL